MNFALSDIFRYRAVTAAKNVGQIIFTLRFPSRSKIYQGLMKKVWKELDLDIDHDWGFNAKEASAGRKSACEK